MSKKTLQALVDPLFRAQEKARELASALGLPLNAQQSIFLRKCARRLRDELDIARTLLRNALLKRPK